MSTNTKEKVKVSEKNKGDDNNPNTKEPEKPTIPPLIVHRSKEGLKLLSSFDGTEVCKTETILVRTEDVKTNLVESVHCSEDGELVAWCDAHNVKCIKIADQTTIFDQQNTNKSNCVYISPKSTKLITYNTMSGGDNLHFWDLYTQSHLLSMPWKKATKWKPIFSMNEDVCLQHNNKELIMYAGGKFDKPKKISHIKIDDVSLSSASFHNSTYQHLYPKRVKNKSHYVAVYTAGSKGQPSIVKIYKYPNMTDAITNKSFFRADSVKFSWSPSGTSLLLICQSDFDKSGKSYFGEQLLNFLNVKGDSYFVKLPKEGAISSIEWVPNLEKDMFVCVYGLQPAKVSLFNNKCEVIFNFGDEGSFNATSFNPFGNMLAVFGIGNLAGQICIWDFEKKKIISNFKVPDTTVLEWCADGKHIMTSTTAPRLRVNNGFRLWHHSGSLIHEKICSDSNQNVEIYDVLWQPKPGQYKRPKCTTKSNEHPNLLSQSKLVKFQSSAAKYVPPSMRGK